MELNNAFTIPVGVDEAWRVLLDVERIAPCMPGATLEGVDGDDYTGKVKVKVGPITVTYRGTARFVEQDEAAHRAVLEASGKEARGTGTAKATVTATLTAITADTTEVTVLTDLAITGKPAQFGRGVLAEVATKLLDRFADCLSEELAGGGGDDAPASAPDAAAALHAAETDWSATSHAETSATSEGSEEPPVLRAVPREADAIDLFDVAGASVWKRAAPVAGVLAFAAFVWRLLRARRRA